MLVRAELREQSQTAPPITYARFVIVETGVDSWKLGIGPGGTFSGILYGKASLAKVAAGLTLCVNELHTSSV